MASEPYYKTVLPKLKELSTQRRLLFGTLLEDVGLSIDILFDKFGNPGQRFPYYIMDSNSIVLGYVMIPKPDRSYSDRAWNRIDLPQHQGMKKFEKDGFKGREGRIVFLQVWEAERDVVLLPFQILQDLQLFREKGDFTVRKDCGTYVLMAPKWEDKSKFKLNTGLNEVFRYL